MNRNSRRVKKVDPQIEARNALIERAKQGDQEAQKILAEAPYFLKIYTPEEQKEFMNEGSQKGEK